MRAGWVLLAATMACGGRVTGGDTDGGTGDPVPAGDDAEDEATPPSADADDFPVCPPYIPASGMACDVPGSGCKYYGATGACFAVSCDAAHQWHPAPEGCQ